MYQFGIELNKKSLSQDGFVINASFPSVEKVNEVLIRSSDFVFNVGSSIRTKIASEKALAEKKKREVS